MNYDLIKNILLYVNFDDLIYCCLVNRQFNKVYNDNMIWKVLCKRDYFPCYISLLYFYKKG